MIGIALFNFWKSNKAVRFATSIALTPSVYGLIKVFSNQAISSVPCLPLPEKV